jgi:hypothetical protein
MGFLLGDIRVGSLNGFVRFGRLFPKSRWPEQVLAILAMVGALLGSVRLFRLPRILWVPYIYLGLLLRGVIWFVILSVLSPRLAGEIRAGLGRS